MISEFQQLKLGIIDIAGLSKDALHVHVGLGVFLTVALVWRGERRFLYAFLTSLAAALIGEILDARDDLGYLGQIRWGAHIHDIVNTAFWPAVLAFVISRLWWRNPAHASRGHSDGERIVDERG